MLIDNTIRLTSARAKSYLATGECQTACDSFITHVLESVGMQFILYSVGLIP
jgi:hypothetical protein